MAKYTVTAKFTIDTDEYEALESAEDARQFVSDSIADDTSLPEPVVTVE